MFLLVRISYKSKNKHVIDTFINSLEKINLMSKHYTILHTDPNKTYNSMALWRYIIVFKANIFPEKK